jgi:hypothetical protein
MMNLKRELLKHSEAAKNKKALELVEKLKAATPVDTGNARDGWEYDGKSIRNDVEYIDALNSGTSTQAPAHFIERTIMEDASISPNGTIVTNSP